MLALIAQVTLLVPLAAAFLLWSMSMSFAYVYVYGGGGKGGGKGGGGGGGGLLLPLPAAVGRRLGWAEWRFQQKTRCCRSQQWG